MVYSRWQRTKFSYLLEQALRNEYASQNAQYLADKNGVNVQELKIKPLGFFLHCWRYILSFFKKEYL